MPKSKKQPDRVTTTQLAKILGIPATKLRNGLQTGRIPRNLYTKGKPGKPHIFDREASVKAWRENANTQNTPHMRRGREGGPNSTPNTKTLVELRADRERVEYEKSKLDLEVKRGKLVVKDDVYKALFEFAQLVRQRLQAVPKRVVDDVLAAPNRADALRILSEQIDGALTELADAKQVKI